MKSTELKIGNFMHFEKTPITVNALIREEVYYDTTNTNGEIGSDVTPIPITEKWLIKFGFEESDWAGGCFIKESIFIDLSDFECGYKKNWFDVKIKYVHQLQNLYFSLTQKELTINE